MSDKEFEQWYVENTFDYPSNPIGSRDCGLQRAAWNAAHAKGREEGLREALTICNELEMHYSAYKDTALLNGDVGLSLAASGEPRACRAIAAAIERLLENP